MILEKNWIDIYLSLIVKKSCTTLDVFFLYIKQDNSEHNVRVRCFV